MKSFQQDGRFQITIVAFSCGVTRGADGWPYLQSKWAIRCGQPSLIIILAIVWFYPMLDNYNALHSTQPASLAGVPRTV